jgi:hypothetical protein
MPSALERLAQHREYLDDAASPLTLDEVTDRPSQSTLRVPIRNRDRGFSERPWSSSVRALAPARGWVVAPASATAVLLVLGGVALFVSMAGGNSPRFENLAPATTITAAPTPAQTPGPTVAPVGPKSPPTTVAPFVTAEPKPACGGALALEGAHGVDGDGVQEEDAPPAPPVPIPTGPCTGTWTTYTPANGLPDCVCDLGVSPDGTVWVLTDLGTIATFNGATWTSIDMDGLVATAVDFTPDGTLWVVGDRGTWTLNGGDWAQIGEATANYIAAAPDGSIWIVGKGTLDHYVGGIWTSHAPSRSWEVAFTAIAPDGTLWFGSDSTLDHYERATWTMHAPDGGFMPNGMEVAPDGSVWMESSGNVGGAEGFTLARYDGNTWSTHPIPAYSDVAFASDGSVWATDFHNGAFRFDGQQWVQYSEDHGLPTNSLEKIAVAPDGTVWFSTFFGDVVRYAPGS